MFDYFGGDANAANPIMRGMAPEVMGPPIPPAMMTSTGGLGGLGGMSPAAGGFWSGEAGENLGLLMRSLGSSLMSSPRNAPLSGMPYYMERGQDRLSKDRLSRSSRAAMMRALVAAGLDEQTATLYAANPDAAKLALDQLTRQRQIKASGEAGDFLGGLYGGAGGSGPFDEGGSPAPAPTGSVSDRVSSIGRGRSDPEGTTGDYLKTLRLAESGGNDAAKNRRSTALGRYQFTEDTWTRLARSNPDLGLTPDGRLDPEQQEVAIRRFTDNNAKFLAGNGIEPTPGNLYTAHFFGGSGAVRFHQGLRENPNAPASAYANPKAVEANPSIFFTKEGAPRSTREVYGLLTDRFTQHAQADVPAEGATEGFYLPGSDPAQRVDGSGRPVQPNAAQQRVAASGAPQASGGMFANQEAAQRAVAAINRRLANPDLPEGSRAALRAALGQAIDFLKPTERGKQLMEAGFVPGTKEYRDAYRNLINSERIPRGFEIDADNPGQLRPIKGGPHDPATTRGKAADPPSGYRFTQDGKGLEFIPGGPADPAKKTATTRPLPHNAVKDIAAAGAAYGDYQRLVGGFRDEFGGYRLQALGDLANVAGRNLPGATDERQRQAEWWADYQPKKNQVRNDLFGSALTATEKAEFEKADINPGMTPKAIKANLDRQAAAATRAAKKLADFYIKSGRSPDEIEAALGVPLEELGVAPGGDRRDGGSARPNSDNGGSKRLPVGGSTTINGLKIERVQ
jgi:hypothetical protein